MSTFNFFQNLNETTKITKVTATCLDLIFTNFKRQHLNVKVTEYGLSDFKLLYRQEYLFHGTAGPLKKDNLRTETWTTLSRR